MESDPNAMAYMAIIAAAIALLILAPIFYAAVFGHDEAKDNLMDLIRAIRGTRTDP